MGGAGVGVCLGGGGHDGRGNKKHTQRCECPLPPTLPTTTPKNLLQFYQKQRGLGGVRRVGGPRRPTGTRQTKGLGRLGGTTFPQFSLKSKTP